MFRSPEVGRDKILDFSYMTPIGSAILSFHQSLVVIRTGEIIPSTSIHSQELRPPVGFISPLLNARHARHLSAPASLEQEKKVNKGIYS